jgi:hypothetical protein
MSTLLDEAIREIFSWPLALRQPRRAPALIRLARNSVLQEVSGAHNYPP